MAHDAQREFCREVQRRFGQYFGAARVLEVGSLDVNGSVRELFQECTYVGIDCRPGPGVDVVCLGHEYAGQPGSFDVACALETFEHDPHAPRTLAHMLGLLRSGGLFVMTCAAEGRGEHGTRRTGDVYGPDAEFYRNVSLRQFQGWLAESGCELDELYLRHNRAAQDLYCYALKS